MISGGRVYDTGAGSDSISVFKLYVEEGRYGFRECNESCYEWMNDLEELLNLGAKSDVTGDSEPDCMEDEDK